MRRRPWLRSPPLKWASSSFPLRPTCGLPSPWPSAGDPMLSLTTNSSSRSRPIRRRHVVDEGYALTRYVGADLPARLGEFTSLYLEVYAEPPYDSGPVWSADAFLDRTRRQAAAQGFSCVAAHDAAGDLIGYSFGIPFAAKQWWANATVASSELIDGPKFAVIELILRAHWRGRGIGRRLLEALLSRRSEPYATLTTIPTAPASTMYAHLGWAKVAEILPGDQRPSFDVLALRLPHE
jgi:GNAT superfamily N-acetyltransferase